jgi:hypothetical protein
MPPIRRRARDPYANQVLGIRVRQAETQPHTPLNLTLARMQLMHAIAAGEVKPGQGQYTGGYRLHGETVTARMLLLINAGWAVGGKHPTLTAAGAETLRAAKKETP